MGSKLLSDAERYFRDLNAGRWDDEPDIVGDPDEPLSRRDPWVPFAEDLLMRASRLVECGRFEEAGPLFELFFREEGPPVEPLMLEPCELLLDLPQPARATLARHLRCVLEAAPPSERAERLVGEIERLRVLGATEVRLRDVLGASPARPLEGQGELLATLPGVLDLFARVAQDREGEVGASGGEHLLALQREAVFLDQGLGALRELVDCEPRHRRGGPVDLAEALAETGDPRAGVAECREALERGGDWPGALGELGELLDRLGEQLGDRAVAIEGARAAWRHAPTPRRLVRLAEVGAPSAGELARRMRDEAAAVAVPVRRDAKADRGLLLLAGGLHEEAVAAAEEDGGFAHEPQGGAEKLVVMALLSALAPHRPERGTFLRRAWLRVRDMLNWSLREPPTAGFLGGWKVPWRDQHDEDVDAVGESFLSLLARRRPSATGRKVVLDALLVACWEVDEDRPPAIWSAHARRACAEALELAGRRVDAARLRVEAPGERH